MLLQRLVEIHDASMGASNPVKQLVADDQELRVFALLPNAFLAVVSASASR